MGDLQRQIANTPDGKKAMVMALAFAVPRFSQRDL